MYDILFWIFVALLMLFLSTLFTVGIFLLVKGIQRKIVELLCLGTSFTVIPIGFVGNFILNIQSGYLFQEIFVNIGFILAVIFTNLTFHKNRKSPAKLILFVVIALAIIQQIFYGMMAIERTPLLYYLQAVFDLPYVFLVFNWLAWSSYSAYKIIKNQDIEPWIKVRYRLISILSFIMSFHSLPEFFQPYNTPWGSPSNIISLAVFGTTAIISVIFAFGFSLAWMMPNWLKKYLNRNYQTEKDSEFTEEELMNLVRKQLTES
jgi:hypothetical protein